MSKGQNKIWRYMPFTQFMALIETEELYFPSLDQLTSEDPYEGRGPFDTPEAEAAMKAVGLSGEPWDVRVSSWCEMEHESYAMWKIYTKNTDGVAIQTTLDDLYEAVKAREEKYVHIRASNIEYSDYASPSSFAVGHLCKRKEFEYESELRLWFKSSLLPGRSSVKFDTTKLIQNVYVDPWSASWFSDLVEAVVNRYSLHSPVIKSSVQNRPSKNA